ncbi:hypothetical protein P0Y35_11825 [Kiritimatiellaeota bacterium B1221]|nr:hypothetical protein [Kiritimatiellaeota bacterium B1221]
MATYDRTEKFSENWKGENGFEPIAKTLNRYGKILNGLQGFGNIDVVKNGDRWFIKGSGTTGTTTSTTFPFKVTKHINDDEDVILRVNAGTINGIVPTNIFAEQVINEVDTYYVGVTLNFTSNSPNDASLTFGSSPTLPSATTEGATPASVSDVIAIVSEGVIYQIRSNNLVATSYEVFREPVSSPDFNQMNFTPWYRWEVEEC